MNRRAGLPAVANCDVRDIVQANRTAAWLSIFVRSSEKAVRQSVTLPSRVARRVRTLARAGHTTASRVMVVLID